jgi:hypothetical protein
MALMLHESTIDDASNALLSCISFHIPGIGASLVYQTWFLVPDFVICLVKDRI